MSDLLPFNAFPAERALAQTTARVGDVPVVIGDLYNPATCPAPLLPWLAWAESVDEWDSNWTEAQKRGVIAASRAVHEKKGTAGVLKLAIEALGTDITIKEWFEQVPPGDPYTCTVSLIIDQDDPLIVSADAIARIVRATKNLRTHVTIRATLVSRGSAFAAAVATTTDFVSIQAEPA